MCCFQGSLVDGFRSFLAKKILIVCIKFCKAVLSHKCILIGEFTQITPSNRLLSYTVVVFQWLEWSLLESLGKRTEGGQMFGQVNSDCDSHVCPLSLGSGHIWCICPSQSFLFWAVMSVTQFPSQNAPCVSLWHAKQRHSVKEGHAQCFSAEAAVIAIA